MLGSASAETLGPTSGNAKTSEELYFSEVLRLAVVLKLPLAGTVGEGFTELLLGVVWGASVGVTDAYERGTLA